MTDVPVRLTIDELGCSSFKLVGEIDAHTAPVLADRFGELPDGGDDVVIDMSDVGFMDSSGLRVVLELQHRLDEASRGLVLRAPSHAVARLIEISGLTDHLHVI